MLAPCTVDTFARSVDDQPPYRATSGGFLVLAHRDAAGIRALPDHDQYRLRVSRPMANGPRPELAPDAPLTLVTLGGVALRARSQTLFEIGKPLALVTYLACAPDRTAPREHLTDLLWGDVEPDAAKHALRQTLWYLKKRLGDRPLVAGGESLTLVGQLECDRDALLAAAERGDAEAAVGLYTGDFFPGFAAPGGVEFERWADAERQRLRSIFWKHAEVLARQRMSVARMKDAQVLARRVRDLDPMREAGWRLLFETIIAGSDTVSAAAELAAFEALWKAESMEPEPATRSLVRALRQTPAAEDPAGDGGGRPLAAELVGREREFAGLIAAWESARAGRAAHVHVVGSAGLGKTRLLLDAHARLRATRARTAFVRSTLGARDIPYGLAGELALALARLPGASGVSLATARTLVVLNPAVSSFFPSAAIDAREAPDDALRRRTAALRELISVLSDEQPLAVLVDDLQWADDASRQVIAGLSGTMEGARALLVTAARPGADLTSPPDSTQTIYLAALSRSAVTALVASIAALPPEPWAEHFPSELWHATAGTPLLVLETLQLSLERGLLECVDGDWRAPKPHDLLAAMQAGGALRHRVERLDRPDRWLLTLLAVAGTPLSAQAVATAVERTVDETVSALVGLEQRGMLMRHGSLWSPSHDEIAAMAIELASDAAVRAAGRGVGRALVRLYGTDPGALRQAGVLLERAQDRDGLALAFSLFVRGLRADGDRRPNVALAREFIGERSGDVTRRLVGSLPFTHRFGLYSTRRQLTLAASLVVLPTATALLRTTLGSAAPPQPDVMLVAEAFEGDSLAPLYNIPIRSSTLTPGEVIRPARQRPDLTIEADQYSPRLAPHPSGAAWLLERVSSDSGGIDIWEASASGIRRLTDARGDDQVGSWSPDGRQIAFHTARWDPWSHYDIATRDMRTGDVRRLTRTSDSDMSARWSPDGSRIAFTRVYWDGRPGAVCVIDVDGGRERCLTIRGLRPEALAAWYDTQRVLLTTPGPSGLLVRLNVGTGAVDTIGPGGNVTVSPDGRWAVCRCKARGFASDATILFPVDAPNRAVEIDPSRLSRGKVRLTFASVARRPRYAERVAIEVAVEPTVGIPHMLSAVGLTPEGDSVLLGSVTWRSADTSVAVIDSAGVLVAKRPGVVEIQVSAGGWRAARRQVTIVAPSNRLVFHETWAGGIAGPWRAFGEPVPRIDSAGGVRGMMNAGDGSHGSGVYTRERYSTARGLVLDVNVSARITQPQWQQLGAALEATLDSARLVRWDHRVGGLPHVEPAGARCIATYPGAREGVHFADSIRFVAGEIQHGAPVPESFRRGTWFRVRVQVFPDGRCGFAVNGVPLFVSSDRPLATRAAWVVLNGNADHTTVLAGETTLREGVPNDIDWSRASLSNPTP